MVLIYLMLMQTKSYLISATLVWQLPKCIEIIFYCWTKLELFYVCSFGITPSNMYSVICEAKVNQEKCYICYLGKTTHEIYSVIFNTLSVTDVI